METVQNTPQHFNAAADTQPAAAPSKPGMMVMMTIFLTSLLARIIARRKLMLWSLAGGAAMFVILAFMGNTTDVPDTGVDPATKRWFKPNRVQPVTITTENHLGILPSKIEKRYENSGNVYVPNGNGGWKKK